MKSSKRTRATACLLLFLLAVPGCSRGGPQRAEVRGTVTFEQTPIESGSIAFVPIDGTQGPTAGGTIAGGAYRIARNEGPVVGRYRVEIRGVRKTGRRVASGEELDEPGELVDEVEMFVPPEYNSRSTLTADIHAGRNEVDFDL